MCVLKDVAKLVAGGKEFEIHAGRTWTWMLSSRVFALASMLWCQSSRSKGSNGSDRKLFSPLTKQDSQVCVIRLYLTVSLNWCFMGCFSIPLDVGKRGRIKFRSKRVFCNFVNKYSHQKCTTMNPPRLSHLSMESLGLRLPGRHSWVC